MFVYCWGLASEIIQTLRICGSTVVGSYYWQCCNVHHLCMLHTIFISGTKKSQWRHPMLVEVSVTYSCMWTLVVFQISILNLIISINDQSCKNAAVNKLCLSVGELHVLQLRFRIKCRQEASGQQYRFKNKTKPNKMSFMIKWRIITWYVDFFLKAALKIKWLPRQKSISASKVACFLSFISPQLRSVSVDLNNDASLLIDIPDALCERDKVKFTVHTKVKTKTVCTSTMRITYKLTFNHFYNLLICCE